MALSLPDKPREHDDRMALIRKLEYLWEWLEAQERERENQLPDDRGDQIAALREQLDIITNTIENVSGDGRIQVHASRYGLSFTLAPTFSEPILLPEDPGFPGEIVTDAGSGAYTFKEKRRADATTWADKTGGRTGTCYEANDVAGIAVGTIIRIREKCDASGTTRYVFNYQRGIVFPITLSYDGGSGGDESNPATWTYTVTDTLAGVELGTTVDPTAGVHKWQRPTVGVMIVATFGYAHRNADGNFVIGWINEVADQEACA